VSLDLISSEILADAYSAHFRNGDSVALESIAGTHKIELTQIKKFTYLLIKDDHVLSVTEGKTIRITHRGIVHAENNLAAPEEIRRHNDEIRGMILEYLDEAFKKNDNSQAEMVTMVESLGIDSDLIDLNLKYLEYCDLIEINSSLILIRSSGLQNLENRRRMTNTKVVRVDPPELVDSLQRFRVDYPSSTQVAFIMMPFEETDAHEKILQAVRDTLQDHGFEGIRADHKEYSPDLIHNVRTYMHGCGFGIAIFERLLGEDNNPNVALEVGYLMALGKPVCLLKDQTLKTLQTDLAGRLYRTFDPQDPKCSIPNVLEKWISDIGLDAEGINDMQS
jgi:hypothetical protein